MIFWTANILILSVVASVISGIPLRASDLDQNGHLVHYHRDNLSGGHVRHIHYRPAAKRSPKTIREKFMPGFGSLVNPSAVYKVQSNKHNNDALSGRMAIQLRSLAERTFGENNNTSDVISDNSDNGDNNNEAGIHSVQNRDAPSPPSETHVHSLPGFTVQSLPHGLQFLNRQSQVRRQQSRSDQSNSMTLDLNALLGETVETTTPSSLNPAEGFLSTGNPLDLGFLLGGLGALGGSVPGHDSHGQDHSHQGHRHQSHAHSHHIQSHHGHGDHSHTHNSIHDKAKVEPLIGLFNQPHSHNKHSHVHQEIITPPSTLPSRVSFQSSTQQARPITKRGVMDIDSVSRFPKTFIDNILNIRIMRTTLAPAVHPTTQPTRYGGYLTTPRSMETQIERLSGIDLSRVRKNNRAHGRKNDASRKQTTTVPKIVAPSQQELVHLQGIHVMFSGGNQDKTGEIPTVHLTAAVSDNINHMLQMASGGSQNPGQPQNINQITDKITGTAVIRDGHLYLVIYPFGNNKSLELHYNQTTKRIPLPRNKPVSFSGSNTYSTKQYDSISKLVQPTSKSRVVSSTVRLSSVKPTAQSSLSSTSHSDISTSSKDSTSAAHAHKHVSKSEVTTSTAKDKGLHEHAHHLHHHSHHKHDSSTPSLTGLKLSEVNDTTLQTLLAPINRFVSPWDSLNFSKVFPYSAGNIKNKTSKSPPTKKVLEEDSEVDVVTFVAKATDPFNRMKVIIESLVNKTLLNDSSTPSPGKPLETKFNFELKLESGNAHNTQNNIQSSADRNNSEENIFDTNVNATGLASKPVKSLNQFEQVTKSMSTTTSNPFFAENRATVGRSSGETITPSSLSFDKLAADRNLQITTTNIPSGDTTSAKLLTETKQQGNIDKKPPAIKNASTNRTNTNYFETAKPAVNLPTVPKNDRLLHDSENIVSSTSRGIKENFYGSKTTLSYIPNYSKSNFDKQPTYRVTTPSMQREYPKKRDNIPRKPPVGSLRNTILGSSLQPFVQRTSSERFRQGLNRGQSEHIISLADILNEIRRIQLHNMHRFNIQNNNFDTMILSETQQKSVVRKPIVMEGPVIKETSSRRYSDYPTVLSRSHNEQLQKVKFSSVTPSTTPVTQKRFDRHAVYDNGFEAMLVLSIDDIMSDQTDLHGAIVLSHRREVSSSNTK